MTPTPSQLIVAFTGTRQGLTPAQTRTLDLLVGEFATLGRTLYPQLAHSVVGLHGMCQGGDATFDRICKQHRVWTEGYPGKGWRGDSPWRDQNVKPDLVHLPELYLDRDHIMVDRCQWLIAGPDQEEYPRSGTWTTVRYARKQDRYRGIIMPDGTTTWEKRAGG